VRELNAARASVDKAYLSTRRVDDVSQEMDAVVELDHALALVVAAHRRCEQATRRAIAAAVRLRVRDAERFAGEAARDAREAGLQAARVDRLARAAEKAAERGAV
jgi:hypothetical protein